MADGGMPSRSSSSKMSRQTASRKSSQANRPPSTDILSKEEEYKRLNEELERKTASLIRDAEEVMREQSEVLSKSRLLDNINTEEFLKEFDEDLTTPNEDITSQPSSSRPSTKLTNRSQPQSVKSQPQPKAKRPSSKPRAKSNVADDVAVPDDAFMTEFRDMSMQQTFANIEARSDLSLDNDFGDDILPQAAADMGSEATIRFLKAKLRVMQEELDRLAQELNKREEENTKLRQQAKELEEDRNKYARTSAAQQTQIDKLKKMADDNRLKWDTAEGQVTTLKKEVENLKRNQKQQSTAQNATEVRLNRALEEVQKYKDSLQRARNTSKESTEGDKKRFDQLIAENKKLEKQKNELMAGFKKQLRLIDILKKQKMHVEAAKLLQFSEEEFVKALEWGD